MDHAQRGFSRHKHQQPPLLEGHIGRPFDQRPRRAGCDRRHRPHRAGTDDHASTRRRPRCWRRAAVRVVERRDARIPGRRADRATQFGLRCDAGLGVQQTVAVRRYDERHRTPCRRQQLEQAHRVRRTGRTRNGHDQRRHCPPPATGLSAGSRRRPRAAARCARTHRTQPLAIRSAKTNPKNTTLMMPFIVKNAASSRDRSPRLINECS